MPRNKRSRVVHNKDGKRVRILGKRSPGLCIGCGQMVNHLYPLNDGSGLAYCYPCKKERE